MSEAFERAGYKDPLMKIAVEAWAKWSSRDGQKARHDYVLAQLPKDLTMTLIDRWDPNALGRAISWLLDKAEALIQAQKPKTKQDTGPVPVGGGHLSSDTQVNRAPATPSRDDARPQAERRSEPAMTAAPTNADPPAAPSTKAAQLKRMADMQVARTLANIEVQKRLCKLDTFKIGDKPIGDCHVIEVRNWLKLRDADRRAAARDVQFASNLIANLPGDVIIRDCWNNADEVDRLYEKAELEYAA